jgi:hypothetical protein
MTGKIKAMLLLAFCCLLSGCQLAIEDAGGSASRDRLIGVYITKEYLDLFDFEGYLNDSLNKPGGFSGGEIKMDGDASKYEGRVYASLTKPANSNAVTAGEYVFENLEGMGFLSPTLIDSNGDRVIGNQADDGISDIRMARQEADDEDKTELYAKVYVSAGGDINYLDGQTLYFNPVYQDGAGGVYLTAGSGFSTAGSSSEGSVYAQTLTDSVTVTADGKSKTESISVEMAIETIFAPEKIALLQMNAAGELVRRDEFLPEATPEELAPEDETEFIVVETHKRHTSGESSVSREVLSAEDETFETFYERGDGICVKRTTAIKWGANN